MINMKSFNKNKITLSLLLLSLTACDPDKPHLKGKRESFIEQIAECTKNVSKEEMSFSDSIANDTWPQRGGRSTHAMPSVQLSKQIKKAWIKEISQGSSSEQKQMPNFVADKNGVYVMDCNGRVSACSHNGEILWTMETSPKDKECDTLGGGLCLSDNVLIVTTSFGYIFSVDAKTGKQLWMESTSNPLRTSATVSNSVIYVSTISNEVHAYDLKDGKKIWSHQGVKEASAVFGGASPAVKDDIVVIGYSSGEYCALNAKDGSELWTDTITSAIRSDTVSSIAHIRANPVIEGDVVYVISHGGTMVANNLTTGERLWQQNIGGALDFTINGNFIFLVDHLGNLMAIDKKGGCQKWKKNLNDFVKEKKKEDIVLFTSPIFVNNQLVLANSKGNLYFINAKDGSLISTINIEAPVTQSPIVTSKTLYIWDNKARLSSYK